MFDSAVDPTLLADLFGDGFVPSVGGSTAAPVAFSTHEEESAEDPFWDAPLVDDTAHDGDIDADLLDAAQAVIDFDTRPEIQQRAKARMSLEQLRRKYRDDFKGFCKLLKVKPKDSSGFGVDAIPFVLTPIQERYCDMRSARDIILKARQVMITTIELARDLWYWTVRLGSNVVVICQSVTDNSPRNDLVGKFKVMLDALLEHVDIEFEKEAAGEWQIRGGGTFRITVAGASEKAAQKKGRGGTIQRLHVTEMAFWEHAGTTLTSLLASIPKKESGSEIVIETTPNGAGGEDRSNQSAASGGPLFYWWWKDAEERLNGFNPVFFPWYECADYTAPLDDGETITPRDETEQRLIAMGCKPEQIKWRRIKIGEIGLDKTDQEYASDPETCFLVSGRQFFDKRVTALVLAKAQRTEPLNANAPRIVRSGCNAQLNVWRKPVPTKRYLITADVSEGTGNDRAGAMVFEVGAAGKVYPHAVLIGQIKPSELGIELDRLGRMYAHVDSQGATPALIAVERNNHGHACIQKLEDLGYPNIFKDRDEKLGWLNHEVYRIPALAALEEAWRMGIFVTYDRLVVGEFRTFVVSKSGKPQAASGANDDLVIMSAIGLDVLRRWTGAVRVFDVEEQADHLGLVGRSSADDDGGDFDEWGRGGAEPRLRDPRAW